MIVEEAFKELYPRREFYYDAKLRYSGKFKNYNGNIMLRGKELIVSMSKEWKEVDDDIKKGLIQILFNKLFKTRKKTVNMDLYNIFLQKVHISVPKTETNPILAESFHRINEKYLSGSVGIPNLKWGINSMRKLGHYEYGGDIIVISSILKEAPEVLLDLVMYHEVLHKKHKFKTSSQRSSYHTKEFKADERCFDDYEEAEKRLTNFLRKKKIRRFFSF